MWVADSGGAFPELRNSEAHVLDVPHLAVFESLQWVKHRFGWHGRTLY